MTVEKASKNMEFEKNGRTYTVGRCMCRDKRGSWFCVTCGEDFVNQFMKDVHISKPGKHVLAWLCPEHGPVVP